MTDSQFWDLIDAARRGSAASAPPKQMEAVLAPLTNEEIIAFGTAFYEKVCDLNHWNLWGAGWVIAGGMSDDSFHYFRSWIVGKGREVFQLALASPDDLGPHIDDPEVNNELLEYITIDLLKARGSDVDPRDLATRSADFDAPSGDPFEEETVVMSFPKLALQFA